MARSFEDIGEIPAKAFDEWISNKSFQVMNPDITPDNVIFISLHDMEELRALILKYMPRAEIPAL